MAHVGNCNMTCTLHVIKLGNFCLKTFLFLLVFYGIYGRSIIDVSAAV